MDQYEFMEKSDADVLAESREYLETHGWWRGALLGPNRRQVCGMGAVLYSQGWNEHDLDHVHQVTRVLSKVMVAVGRGPVACFTDWNDHQVKNKQEVLDAFMKAEKLERSGDVRDEE